MVGKTLEYKIKKQLFLFLIAVVVFGFSLFFGVFSTKAQTVDNLKDQKSQIEEKLAAINKQISQIQGQISQTRSKQASLKNEISLYDNQIKSTELAISAKETQIEDADIQIKLLLLEIEKRENERQQNRQVLAELIKQLNELDVNYELNISFGSDRFSDFLDDVKYTQNVQEKIFHIIENIKQIKAKLEVQEKELEAKRDELTEFKEQLTETKSSLITQRGQKDKLLTTTKGLERNYQALYSESSKEAANLQQEILDLDKSIADKLGVRTITPGKGALAKPMKGTMTQGYGKTGFTSLGYSSHNGIDLAAAAGEPIYAAADGTVIGADTGEAAYGNWVTIKHNVETKTGNRGIITLYAHMRTFKVKVGQVVRQGDLIGYEGNTGNTTRLLYGPERGYHLHFTVFDTEGYGVSNGKYSKVYGSYTVPYGYTYNPLDFFK